MKQIKLLLSFNSTTQRDALYKNNPSVFALLTGHANAP